ncbi:MAG: hypothetical protein IKE36_11820 [Solobacterium sp.]|nr:hypothetical protein [Solobacterium sp.]
MTYADEPDAFPFKGDPVLHGIARTSCHGHTIYLTATPDKELEKRVKKGDLYCLELNQRPHGHPLPEPDVHTGPVFLRLIWMFRWIRANEGHPRIIFVPTIKMGEWVFRFLRLWMPVYFCTSKTPDRDMVIENFRKEKAGIMIATTVLERGVTIPDVNICIYQADHQIFDKAGLIQMAGRAGRTFDYPDGNVLFIQSEYSQTAMDCINDIRRANQSCGV